MMLRPVQKSRKSNRRCPVPWAATLVLAASASGIPAPVHGANEEPTSKPGAGTQPATDRGIDADAPKPVDDELVRKMLQRAAGEGDDEEVIQRVMRLMEASRLRLATRFDPGEQTQRVQRRILEDLDEAIKRSGKRNPRSQQKPQRKAGDRRKRGQRQQQPPQQGRKQNKGQGKQQKRAAENAGGAKGAAEKGKGSRTPAERGRQWGNLPPRDREAVLQGIKDDYLPKFKEMIERYYKALSKPEKAWR